MNLLAAPIIHAKTLNIDFRPNLFAAPDDFTSDKIAWAKKFILSSTRFIEYLDGNYRKLLFSDGKTCVVGVTANVQTLYEKCGEAPEFDRDSANRKVYCFIGLAFNIKKGQLPLIDIPFKTYLQLYKELVGTHWNDDFNSTDESKAYRTQYSNFSVSEINDKLIPADTIQKSTVNNYTVMEAGYENDDKMFRYAQKKALSGSGVSYCSNLPNVNSDSPFHIVTAKNSREVLNNLQSKAFAKATDMPKYNTTNKRKKNESELLEDVFNQANSRKASQTDSLDFLTDTGIILGVIAGVTYILVADISSPVILAVAGTATAVLTGAELYRIMKRLER